MTRGRPGLVLAALAILTPGAAHAALCGTFLSPVTVTASPVAFGSYTATRAGPTDASGDITIRCGLPADVLPSFTISLSAGSGGGYSPRRMTSGGSHLNYNLYTASDHATVWGDGSGATQTISYSSVLLLGSVTRTVHGRIPAGQWSAAGAYQDTILVVVTY